jgi:multicomponent K+:H+ antiporter subunit D
LLPTVVVGAMVAAVAMLSAFAGPVMNDMTATAEQIFMPQRYIAAVLHRQLASDLVGE